MNRSSTMKGSGIRGVHWHGAERWSAHVCGLLQSALLRSAGTARTRVHHAHAHTYALVFFPRFIAKIGYGINPQLNIYSVG